MVLTLLRSKPSLRVFCLTQIFIFILLVPAFIKSQAATDIVYVYDELASSSSFVVGDSSLPTITSFTPNIGTPGTAITITGTNFDTVATNNRVKVNTSLPSVGATTAISIDATVSSSTGSGRISVATVSGAATSTADFFVPPSPYTTADVLVTDRMTLGDSRTVALGTANKIGLVVFDATERQRVSIKTNSSTIASGTITIFNPKGV